MQTLCAIRYGVIVRSDCRGALLQNCIRDSLIFCLCTSLIIALPDKCHQKNTQKNHGTCDTNANCKSFTVPFV